MPRKRAFQRGDMQTMIGLATGTSLVYPFPLSKSRMAQIIMPRDMNQEEANRLCAFVQALATQPPMEEKQ